MGRVEAVLGRKLEIVNNERGNDLRDQLDFAYVLKDGVVLCQYYIYLYLFLHIRIFVKSSM